MIQEFPRQSDWQSVCATKWISKMNFPPDSNSRNTFTFQKICIPVGLYVRCIVSRYWGGDKAWLIWNWYAKCWLAHSQFLPFYSHRSFEHGLQFSTRYFSHTIFPKCRHWKCPGGIIITFWIYFVEHCGVIVSSSIVKSNMYDIIQYGWWYISIGMFAKVKGHPPSSSSTSTSTSLLSSSSSSSFSKPVHNYSKDTRYKSHRKTNTENPNTEWYNETCTSHYFSSLPYDAKITSARYCRSRIGKKL